jgi:hypothetical protein
MEPTPVQLERLLGTALELDERVDRINQGANPSLSADALRSTLIGFAVDQLTTGQGTPIAEEPRFNPLLTVNRLIKDGEGASPAASLSIQHICQLKFVEFFFNYLEGAFDLHPFSYNALQHQQFGFARCLLEEPATLIDPQHPVREFFEASVRACKGFDDTSGPRALDVLEQIRSTTLGAVADSDLTRDSFTKAQQGFAAFMQGYDQRLSQLERLVIERQETQLLLNNVRTTVADVISRALSGKRLPLFIVDFLRRTWSKYLYVVYLRQGVESDQWRQAISDMYQLIWSVATRDAEELKRRMREQLPHALGRIRAGLGTFHHNLPVDKLFAALEAFHIAIIRGKEPDKELFKIKRVAEDAKVIMRTGIFEHVIRPADEIMAAEPGGWYKIHNRGLTSRVKLVERNTAQGYLLFANYSGVLSARMAFDKYLMGLGNHEIEILDLGAVFEPSFTSALERLTDFVDNLSRDVAQQEERENERRARVAREEREREERRAREERERRELLAKAELDKRREVEEQLRKLEEEVRRRDAEEAERRRLEEEEERRHHEAELAFKRQLEEETIRKEEEARRAVAQKAEEQKQAREEALRRAIAELEQLEVGGMVELLDEDNESQVCALSMKLKSTGKLVFVDRTGRKIAEYQPEQLAEKVIQGSATVIDYEAATDKRMDDLRWMRYAGPGAGAPR